MSYEEWLDAIEQVMKRNRNIEYLQKMQEAGFNPNINELLKPKIEELITKKFIKAIKRITNNVNDIFHNPNSLMLSLTTYKKDVEYLIKLIDLPQLDANKKQNLKETIDKENKEIYNIIENKAIEIDPTGMYKSLIEKNKIGDIK